MSTSFMTGFWNGIDTIYVVSAPFSYSCTKVPKDAEDQIEAAMGAASAIKAAHGVAFTVSLVYIWYTIVALRNV